MAIVKSFSHRISLIFELIKVDVKGKNFNPIFQKYLKCSFCLSTACINTAKYSILRSLSFLSLLFPISRHKLSEAITVAPSSCAFSAAAQENNSIINQDGSTNCGINISEAFILSVTKIASGCLLNHSKE